MVFIPLLMLMTHKKLERLHHRLLVSPCVLVGTMVDGRENFMVLADVMHFQYSPMHFAISCGKNHHTTRGIQEHGAFSVSVPSVEMLELVDYCGLVSGANQDKSLLFEVFQASIAGAPLVRDAPITTACKVVQEVDIGGANYLFLGEVLEVHVMERCITKRKPDLKKCKPFLISNDNTYRLVGDKVGDAYREGMVLKRTRTGPSSSNGN
ncbi:flavin reductase family protein [Candidatus Bathyarchaeota archaeon]|nr:flavin reductase family protein [Candidatus Bathyarchaeota archaeon]